MIDRRDMPARCRPPPVLQACSAPQLTVQRNPERSSWVALPPSLASQLYQSKSGVPLVLEVRTVIQQAGISLPSDTPSYVAWGGACGAPGSIGIPAGLLSSLGLPEGRPVVVRPLWDVPRAVCVSVEPASEDDWEMVELNAEYLEGQLLSQVGMSGHLLWQRVLQGNTICVP